MLANGKKACLYRCCDAVCCVGAATVAVVIVVAFKILCEKENKIDKDQNGNVFICLAINGIRTMTRYEVPINGVHETWKYENVHVFKWQYSKCKEPFCTAYWLLPLIKQTSEWEKTARTNYKWCTQNWFTTLIDWLMGGDKILDDLEANIIFASRELLIRTIWGGRAWNSIHGTTLQ